MVGLQFEAFSAKISFSSSSWYRGVSDKKKIDKNSSLYLVEKLRRELKVHTVVKRELRVHNCELRKSSKVDHIQMGDIFASLIEKT